MKNEVGKTRGAVDRQEEKDSGPTARRSWETPRILWTGKIQTLAYQCSSGPAPVSGSPTEGCPP